MNVTHLLCVSTSAHIFCMLKKLSVIPRVNVDLRRSAEIVKKRRKLVTKAQHAFNANRE